MVAITLSEAITLGACLRPQGFGELHRRGQSCALGAAGEAVGVYSIDTLHHAFPLLRSVAVPPVPRTSARFLDSPLLWAVDRWLRPKAWTVWSIIVMLNDQHHWPRTQIATWVATLEAQPAARVEMHEPECCGVADASSGG